MKSGDLEFYEVLKKKYPFEEYTEDSKKEIVFQAIEDGDLAALKNYMPVILKEYENLESYAYYSRYTDLLNKGIKSGELDIVEYVVSKISPKYIDIDREEYETMIERAAIIWDDPAIFDYLYKIVLSFKNRELISSIRKEIKNIAVCIPNGEKYLKKIK